MTLTDLANHICTQCGMTDTDDVAAAKMFLQRRLEMIWNSALWRDSLLEATLTLNPDDTTSLADSYWISERSVLLLPSAIERVIAARLNTNTLEAASLESYYRSDTDWLDYQGTPYEFQVLKPVVMEWLTAQPLAAADASGAEMSDGAAVACNYSYSPDGVTITSGMCATNGQIGTALQLFSFSKPVTTGDVSLLDWVEMTIAPSYAVSTGVMSLIVPCVAGQVYQVIPGAAEVGAQISNGTQMIAIAAGVTAQFTAQGNQFYIKYPNVVPAGSEYTSGDHNGYFGLAARTGGQYTIDLGANDEGYALNTDDSPLIVGANVPTVVTVTGEDIYFYPKSSPGAVTAQVFANCTATISNAVTFATVKAGCNVAGLHQRIRLTEAPTVAVNLRVLGKGKCPILGAYDTTPITNSEPALLAFGRGDLLLRQRQFGKAALAQQEGAALLKELTENEAFQQAGEFRIEPEGGFGTDILWRTAPDSYHPLG
ncbi:MAG: hypothetical protein ACREFR_06385 [Limisphaerales bacterium]